MKTANQITGVKGTLIVHEIVNNHWESDWQKIDAENDDAIDGIIHVRKNKELTGEVIYVQVKTGGSYKVITQNRPEYIGVNVGVDYIRSHRPRWNSLKGAVILVFVDDDGKAYWTDLKSETSFSNTNASIILIPKTQRFGAHSKGHFKKIGDIFPQDRHLESLRLEASDLSYLRINVPIKNSAREYYKEWAASPAVERLNDGLGEVLVTRCGWRHISRKQRGYDKIFQSWQLLSAAKKIVQEIDKAYQITKMVSNEESSSEHILKDFISLRAKIIFPNRHQSVVQVILRRRRIINKIDNSVTQKVWFYSVYEPRRGVELK